MQVFGNVTIKLQPILLVFKVRVVNTCRRRGSIFDDQEFMTPPMLRETKTHEQERDSPTNHTLEKIRHYG